MKKNEHYFPTIEYVKDKSEALGWRKVIHEAEDGGAREDVVVVGDEEAVAEE